MKRCHFFKRVKKARRYSVYLVVTPTILSQREVNRLEHVNEIVRRHTHRKLSEIQSFNGFDIIRVLTHVDDFDKTHKRLRRLIGDIQTNNMLLRR